MRALLAIPQTLTNLYEFYAGYTFSYFSTREGELKLGRDDSGRQPLPSTPLEIVLSFISARPFVFSPIRPIAIVRYIR